MSWSTMDTPRFTDYLQRCYAGDLPQDAIRVNEPIFFANDWEHVLARLAIQASCGHYCYPKENLATWDGYKTWEVTVNFLERDSLQEDEVREMLKDYGSGGICTYVPTDVVQEVFETLYSAVKHV